VIHEAIKEELESQSKHRAEANAAPAAKTVPADTRAVLMAIASKGGGVINEHFGHAREFLVYEASPGGVRFIGHRKTDLYCTGNNTCGEEESALDRSSGRWRAAKPSSARMGRVRALGDPRAAGIQPNGEHGMERIEDAVAAVYREMYEAGRLTSRVSQFKRLVPDATEGPTNGTKDHDKCVNCYACVDVCPTASISGPRRRPIRHRREDVHRMRRFIRRSAVREHLSDRRGDRPPRRGAEPAGIADGHPS